MNTLSGMRPCLVAGTLGRGGAERQLYYILQALREAGAMPRLLSLTRGEHWEQAIRSLGVPVTMIGDSGSRLRRLFILGRHLWRDRAEVVQSQHFHTNAYVGIASRLLGLRGIGAMRNDGRSEVTACGRFGGWLSLHSPGMLAANSEEAIRYARNHGLPAARLFLLPNVVDTEHFTPGDRASAGPVTLLAAGRLVRQKRLDRFIHLLARLRDFHRLDVRGMIVGAGSASEDLRADMVALARRLGLSPEALQFRGGVADMRPVYHEATILVLTSDHEGTPNVLLEAMASGLPVVATRVGGVPEIVRNGEVGFLVEPDDAQGLASAVITLIKNPERTLEMGRHARDFVVARHGRQRLPAYLSGLYQWAQPVRNNATVPAIADVVN